MRVWGNSLYSHLEVWVHYWYLDKLYILFSQVLQILLLFVFLKKYVDRFFQFWLTQFYYFRISTSSAARSCRVAWTIPSSFGAWASLKWKKLLQIPTHTILPDLRDLSTRRRNIFPISPLEIYTGIMWTVCGG